MKKLIIFHIVFICFVLIYNGCDDSEVITFQNTYGSSNPDYGNSVIETSDGAYIICGETGHRNTDIYLIKIDNEGNLLWEKTYGGADGESGNSVVETSDGAYIICGTTYSFGAGRNDAYLIKVDNEGNLLWEKTYGGSDSDSAYSVIETSDGAYIICGRTCSFGAGKDDAYLIKVDNKGNILWEKAYGGSEVDFASSVIETDEGGYMVLCDAQSVNAGIYLIKTNIDGNIIWGKPLGGNSYGSKLIKAGDGGYIVCGNTYSYGSGGSDIYIIKVDNRGNILWDKTYGGSDDDYGISISRIVDGGYIIGGRIEVSHNNQKTDTDFYLIRIDNKGNKKWEKTHGGNENNFCRSVIETGDYGYILCGDDTWDVYIIKTDKNGNIAK